MQAFFLPRLSTLLTAREESAPFDMLAGIAASSALGIFTLYHFETRLAYAPIPLVAILVFAGGLSAIALDVVILKERITTRKALAMVMVFLGGFLITSMPDRRGVSVRAPARQTRALPAR